MIISMIVAASENNAIGKDNKLIWHLPADLKLFKTLTMGHHMIMGRKTYESIGKALPGRVSIVISRQEFYKAEDCFVVHSLEEALNKASGDSEVFIIGGDAIFKSALPIVDKVYLTRVHATFEADTFFPELSAESWELLESTPFKADEKNKYDYSFQVFSRK